MALFGALDADVGSDGRHEVFAEFRAGLGIELSQLVPGFANPLDRVAGDFLNQRQAIVAEIFEVAGNERLQLLEILHVGMELREEAFAQIAGGDAGRIERLHQGEGFFGLLLLLGRGVGGKQIAKAGAEVAAVFGIERADDSLAEGKRRRIDVQLAKLMHQIILQRFGALGDVGDDIVGPLGVFFDAAGGATSRFFEILGNFAVEVQQALEIVGVVMGLIDNQRLLVDLLDGRIFALFVGLIGERRVALLQLEGGIFDQLLLDPLLQILQGKLQDLHRLDHPRCQLLHLELAMF